MTPRELKEQEVEEFFERERNREPRYPLKRNDRR